MECLKGGLHLALPASTISPKPPRTPRPTRFALPSPSGETKSETNSESELHPSLPPPRDDLPATAVSLTQAFGRRFVLGGAAAVAITFGGNLGGVTSFVLSLNANFSRKLKLDALYPVNGYKRCTERDFEFIYPATWVGDQRLLYRAAERMENLNNFPNFRIERMRKNSPREPVVAFGPPGSSGELNVSVIVAPIPLDFRLEKIGGPKEAGELILNNFIASKTPKVIATLINAKRCDEMVRSERVSYYKLEFSVEGQSFLRHNIAVYCAHNGQLLSFNAQTPETLWSHVMAQFHEMADSFTVIF